MRVEFEIVLLKIRIQCLQPIDLHQHVGILLVLLLYTGLQLPNLLVRSLALIRYYYPLLLLLAIPKQQRLVPLADLYICSRVALTNLSYFL